jgi:7-cyano-7-deazaguanine synthase in queuosine biosynthesis
MISLVMLSGGIDSTYALARLLAETDDEVVVHHVHLITDANRHQPEKEACNRIVEFCRSNYRDFSYTESAIDRRRFVTHGIDVVTAGFEAGNVSASFYVSRGTYIDRWFMGLCNDDDLPRRRVKHAQDCCEYNCPAGCPPLLYFFETVSLQAQIDYMPAELLDLTWSCRAPISRNSSFAPCGNCQACLRRSTVKRSVDADDLASKHKLQALPWGLIVRRGEKRARAAALRQVTRGAALKSV